MQAKGNFIESAVSQTPHPFPSDLDTLLLECSSVKVWLYEWLNVVDLKRILIVIVSYTERCSEWNTHQIPPFFESVTHLSEEHNTYANAGKVTQFDFHQTVKSTVFFPLLSFLSSTLEWLSSHRLQCNIGVNVCLVWTHNNRLSLLVFGSKEISCTSFVFHHIILPTCRDILSVTSAKILFSTVYRLWPALRSFLMQRLYCLCYHPPPQYLTIHPLSPSHSLTHRSPPLHHSHSPCPNLYSRHFVMTVLEASSQWMLQNWLVMMLLG